MRLRLCFAALCALSLVAALAAPAAGHHPDKERDATPLLEIQEHERQNVTAADAAAISNAPRGHAPCVRGMAAGTYPCHKVDMLSHLSLGDLGLTFVNDMWGWADPETGKDYALVGGTEGTTIVDVSDPKRPDVVGTLPTASTSGPRLWRDIKVYADHMFVVSEHFGHGMQVFDLTRVRGVTGAPATFTADAVYFGFERAHNLHINEDTGFAYVAGVQTGAHTCASGLHMVDLSTPASPVFAGCFSAHDYIHDTQCVVYRGPDPDHQGREICFNSAAHYTGDIFDILNTLSIVDVTDKSAPVPLARVTYPDDGYSHQGWLTPDQRYFLHNDELDEYLGVLPETTTRIFDVADLDAPVLVATVEHGTTSIGHNLYTEGRYGFAANYTAGLRVYDIGAVAAGAMPEVAFFDAHPTDDDPTFFGAWTAYPYFAQKKVVGLSSSEMGLFVLRPRIGS